MIDARRLLSSDIFGALDDAALSAVVAAGSVRRVGAGTVIFAQGDAGLTCHSLLEGRIKIVKTRPDGGQSVLRFIGPGEMYGTVAAMMNKPFPADAVAVVDSVEIVWTVAAMRRLMREWPEIGINATASGWRDTAHRQPHLGRLGSTRCDRQCAPPHRHPRRRRPCRPRGG